MPLAENTNLRGSIPVWWTSCLYCLDSAALQMLNEQQFYLFSQIQTSQTGGHLYTDTSPYKASECSLYRYINDQFVKSKLLKNITRWRLQV